MTKDYDIGELDDRLAEREWMVRTQLVGRDITDEAVINSMLIVKRHKYVMADKQEYAYYDNALEIEHWAGRKKRHLTPYWLRREAP